MARNQVKQLWTVIVTAFLALCTALGLITTTAAAAVPQTEPARNSGTGEVESPQVTIPAQSPWSRSPWSGSHARALPPTMKQRIHAEAHGKSPSCRHRPLPEAEAAAEAVPAADDAAPAPAAPCDTLTATAPRVPLQR